jgi:hypothetical protein
MWVPFGYEFEISDPSHPDSEGGATVTQTFPNFQASDCTAKFQGGTNGTVFTVCDAGSELKGMARIYQV